MAVSLVAVLSTSVFAQSTITCPSGDYDMVQVMRMQNSWAQNGDFLQGTNQSGGTVYMFQAASDITYENQSQQTGEWLGGKLNYIKNFHEPPASPPDPQEVCSTNCPSPYASPEYVPTFSTTDGNWAFPADVDLFDTNYVYLWITEIDWNNPYSYKAFNSDNNNYSFPFVPRCALPGTSTIQIPEPAGNTVPTSTIPSTAYEIFPANVYNSSGQIVTTDETFTSSDCTGTPGWSDLAYAFTQVNSVHTGFAMTNNVNNTTPSLSYVPVVYWYGCNDDYGSCGNHEEFDYGYDTSTGDYYGLVQWLHFTGTSTNPDETATFNNLEPANGDFSYTTISFPAAACF
jgi:hypothetical protein